MRAQNHKHSIDTRRLSLCAFTQADLHDLHRLWTNPQVRKYLWDDQLIPIETAQEVIDGSLESFNTRGYGFWRLSLKGEVGLIGFAGLRRFDSGFRAESEVELLYGIAPEYFGKGLATEAALAVLRYGFVCCKLERIYAGADPPNTLSFKVMERLGMSFARRLRINGVDSIYYTLTRADFQQRMNISS